MDPIPPSIVAAVACSAAAGKNPWIPLGLLFLLAAPDGVPSLLMETDLHTALHGLGPSELLWVLGIGFLALAVAESLADKLPFIERWLVPVSTAWRPFAAVAVAAIIGYAVTTAPVHETLAAARALPIATADSGLWWSGSVMLLAILGGAVFGWIATIGKTGVRLLLSLVPLPALKLAHSFLDDLFALVVTIAGLAFGDSLIVLLAAVVYLVVGLATGPLLARLTWIHFRIGWGLLRKALRRATGEQPRTHRAPRWLERALVARGVDTSKAALLPCYAYRAPEVGRCRAGMLVLAPDAVCFATRVWLRPRLLWIDEERLARAGLSETATARSLSLVEHTSAGGLRDVTLHLFPAVEQEVLPVLETGAAHAGLSRVRADSDSARRGLPGFAQRNSSVRYLPVEAAGSLRAQALLTIACAVFFGVLSGGVFIPIGAGYALSPFLRRFFLGLAMSGYLSLCVLGSLGIGWPLTVLYAVVLNTIALRDLARAAIKARVDGFVDKRAFLPSVCQRVWIPERAVASPQHRWRAGDALPVTDGSWRAIVAVLAQPPVEPPEDHSTGSTQPGVSLAGELTSRDTT